MYRNRGLQWAANLTETDVWQSGKGEGFSNKGGHGKKSLPFAMNIIYLLALIDRQEREQDYLKQVFLYLLHGFASLNLHQLLLFMGG